MSLNPGHVVILNPEYMVLSGTLLHLIKDSLVWADERPLVHGLLTVSQGYWVADVKQLWRSIQFEHYDLYFDQNIMVNFIEYN